MECSIYQIERIFAENPNLKPVCTYIWNSICYGHISARGWRWNSLTLQNQLVCYIKMTAVWRRVWICNGTFLFHSHRFYTYWLHRIQYSYIRDNVQMIWLFENEIQSMPDTRLCYFYIVLFNKEALIHANQCHTSRTFYITIWTDVNENLNFVFKFLHLVFIISLNMNMQ